MQVPVLNACVECNRTVGATIAHKCAECEKPIHAICGVEWVDPATGEVVEGFGAPRLCFACNRSLELAKEVSGVRPSTANQTATAMSTPAMSTPATSTVVEVSPARAALRSAAAEKMKAKGRAMQARASRISGGDLNVGDVVQFGLHNVDRAKLDDPNLTCVVVEVVNPTNNRVGQEKARRGEPNYRLGTANGYMEMPVSRPYITALQNTTVEGMGLTLCGTRYACWSVNCQNRVP